MKMYSHNFIRFYRVFKNDTAVTEIQANNLNHSKPVMPFKLPPDDAMFTGYADKAHAMEMAKAGALKYIDVLISEGSKGIEKLKQYREDHYEDLNTNLLDANIRKAEIIKN